MPEALLLQDTPLSIPPLSKPAVTFLGSQINDVHPKFSDLQPTYSIEDGRFVETTQRDLVAIRETQEMQRQKELFAKAVKNFETSRDGTKTGIRLNVDTHHEWSDVIGDLQRIEGSYDKIKDAGASGRVRDCLRRMRRFRPTCEQWIKVGHSAAAELDNGKADTPSKLLPTDSWQGSMICGGIKIVLTVSSFSEKPPILLIKDNRARPLPLWT